MSSKRTPAPGPARRGDGDGRLGQGANAGRRSRRLSSRVAAHGLRHGQRGRLDPCQYRSGPAQLPAAPGRGGAARGGRQGVEVMTPEEVLTAVQRLLSLLWRDMPGGYQASEEDRRRAGALPPPAGEARRLIGDLMYWAEKQDGPI